MTQAFFAKLLKLCGSGLVLLTIFLSYVAPCTAQAQQKIDIGDAAPSIDTVFSKADVTLVVFWGTWCEPCRAEIPTLNELAKNPRLNLIGIALEGGATSAERRKTVADFMADTANHRPTYRIVVDGFADGPMKSSWVDGLDLFGIPVIVAVARDGRIAAVLEDSPDTPEFQHGIDLIQKGQWDFARAKAEYAPRRAAKIAQRETYALAMQIRAHIKNLDPAAALAIVEKDAAANPALLDYLGYDRISLALAVHRDDIAIPAIRALVETYGHRAPHILSHFLAEFQKLPALTAAEKALRLEIAHILYVVTQGGANDAEIVLNDAGLAAACDGDVCVPLPRLAPRCLDLFSL